MGVPQFGNPIESTTLEKGITGVFQDSIASGVHSVISAGGEITTLSGTASTVGLTGAEYASGVGELKFGYDVLTYFAGLATCVAK